jgi:pimeloyl-ACP methyl ester carboxylesterase
MRVRTVAIAALGVLLSAGARAQGPTTLAELGEAWRAELVAAGFEPRTIDEDGNRLSLLVDGDGPPLLFLHGVGDHAGTWHAVAPAFADRYRVVLVDLPGHGASEPRESEVLPMATVVAGAERALAEFAAERPAIVVGNSMGAWLATLLAHRYPESVERIVLIDGGAIPGEPGGPSLMPATREQAKHLMGFLRDPESPPVPEWLLDDLVRRAPTSATARMTRDLPGLFAHMLIGRLGEITTPVDLLWGASDRLLPLAYAERMAAQLSAARVTPIARCGHVPQAECPERFAAALAELLAAAPPAPAAEDAPE